MDLFLLFFECFLALLLLVLLLLLFFLLFLLNFLLSLFQSLLNFYRSDGFFHLNNELEVSLEFSLCEFIGSEEVFVVRDVDHFLVFIDVFNVILGGGKGVF